MELARHCSRQQPRSLNIAAIPFVFTIARVTEMLGEDEEWLHELSMGLDP